MPPESIIRSRQNPIYKQIRSLLRRDRRHQERAFLVEGPRFVHDAMASGATPTLVAVSESFATDPASPPLAGPAPRIFDDELFATLTDTVTSQGVIAVFSIPELTPLSKATPFILIADGVRDPGNLGTLIRAAAGAGATQVIALPGTVDPWAPKVVRAAAAAHFLIPIVPMGIESLGEALPAGCRLVAADANASTQYDDFDFAGPVAVIVGSEGSGLSGGSLGLDPTLLSIPLAAGLESLNAGIAGSIVLFEVSRQRRNRTEMAKTPVSG